MREWKNGARMADWFDEGVAEASQFECECFTEGFVFEAAVAAGFGAFERMLYSGHLRRGSQKVWILGRIPCAD
jgi:hypothetical protein